MYLTHLSCPEHGLTKVDGAARLEVQLEFGLAGKVAVGLGADAALDVVGTEDGLLKLDLEQTRVPVEIFSFEDKTA